MHHSDCLEDSGRIVGDLEVGEEGKEGEVEKRRTRGRTEEEKKDGSICGVRQATREGCAPCACQKEGRVPH